jgi:hypothetical protein
MHAPRITLSAMNQSHKHQARDFLHTGTACTWAFSGSACNKYISIQSDWQSEDSHAVDLLQVTQHILTLWVM